MPDAPTACVPSQTSPMPGATVRRLLFFDELLHHVDLDVTLRQQTLQPRVLFLQLTQPLYVRLVHRAVLPTPGVKRRLGDPVRPTQLRDRLLLGLRLAQNPDDLLLGESLLHRTSDPFWLGSLYHPVGTLSGRRTVWSSSTKSLSLLIPRRKSFETRSKDAFLILTPQRLATAA